MAKSAPAAPPEPAPPVGDGTVLLVVAAADPWDKFGHGSVGYEATHSPRDGLWYLRCPPYAAEQFILRGGCIMAPDQNADR
jgi:hypothetical protein